MNVSELLALNGIEIEARKGRTSYGKFANVFPGATINTVTLCKNDSVRASITSGGATYVAFINEDVLNDLVAQGAVTANGNADLGQLANYEVLEPRDGQFSIVLPKAAAVSLDIAVAATSKVVASSAASNSVAAW